MVLLFLEGTKDIIREWGCFAIKNIPEARPRCFLAPWRHAAKARSRGKPAVLLGGFTEDKKERDMKTEVRGKRG